MPDQSELIYWDSCIFLSWLEQTPGRAPDIEGVYQEVQGSKGQKRIVTSTFTVAEVAFVKHEKDGQLLDEDIEQRINDLWNDRTTIVLVEFYYAIAIEARDLMRLGVPRGWSLKGKDALHLATAKRIGVAEFHTYDKDLHRYSADLGFSICYPKPAQPSLGLSSSP